MVWKRAVTCYKWENRENGKKWGKSGEQTVLVLDPRGLVHYFEILKPTFEEFQTFQIPSFSKASWLPSHLKVSFMQITSFDRFVIAGESTGWSKTTVTMTIWLFLFKINLVTTMLHAIFAMLFFQMMLKEKFDSVPPVWRLGTFRMYTFMTSESKKMKKMLVFW